MKNNTNVKGAWITVNRACNMRCKWCYAAETEFKKTDEMTLSLAKKIVDFCADMQMTDITLIGGEPTVWGNLFDLCDYIQKKDMGISLVTNGLRLSEKKYLERILASSINTISFSLKSGNDQQHRDLTQTDSYDNVMRAIQNIAQTDVDVDFSIVVSSLVQNDLMEIISTAANNGAKSFSLQFCSTTFNGVEPHRGFMIEPHHVARTIAHQYDDLCAVAGAPIYIEQSLPACVWPQDFLGKLWSKGNMSVGCHVMDRSGLIFDPEGKIIPCNCLSSASLGQFGVDFTDVSSFAEFWHNSKIDAFYSQITSYPSQQCMRCDAYVHCGGGCPLQWFVYSPDEVITGQIANFTKKEDVCHV